ncbi:MAG: DUF2076 family protein [Burkholderiales bacterium]|jgi:hypothetical protein|nr:DUF2076 family protein [Burkholderiales bacterium]
MNFQEREQLTQFLQQLALAKGGPKDPEAHALIESTVACQPDATYLLVQRSLLQDQALQAAQAQIASLQAELQRSKAPASASGSFLDSMAWGRNPASSVYAQSPVAPPASTLPPAYSPAPAPLAAAPSRFQAPSFLTSMATTAAGVAAGAFLFQGIENLMGHHSNTSASSFGLAESVPAFPSLDSNFIGQSDSLARDAGAFTLDAPSSMDSSGNDEVFDLGDMGGNDWA